VNVKFDIRFSYKLKVADCTSLAAVELPLRGAFTTTCLSTVTVTYLGQGTSLTYPVNYHHCHLVELILHLTTGARNYLLILLFRC